MPDIEVMGPKELKVPLYSYATGSEGLRPGAVRDEELVSQEEISHSSDNLPWPSCGTAWDRHNDGSLAGRATPGPGLLSYAWPSPSA